jgi:SAM-dependent methyltransferase
MSAVRAYYDAYWSEGRFRPVGRLTDPLAALLAPVVASDSDCLDVGCGDGSTCGGWLSERAGSYVGVDISPTAVEAARATGLTAHTVDDASELPFADASFDVVACLEVFEHLFAPQLAAVEIHRVLRPGGVLIVTVPNAAYWRRRLDLVAFGRLNPLGDDESVDAPWRDPHLRFFNRGALGRLLARTGFADVRVAGHGGTALGDVPALRRLGRPRGWRHPEWRANAVYSAFERAAPGLFAYRLHAVARKG